MSIYGKILKAERRMAKYRSSLGTRMAELDYDDYSKETEKIRAEVLDCIHGLRDTNPLFREHFFGERKLTEAVREGAEKEYLKEFIGSFTPLDRGFYMKPEKRTEEKVKRAELVSKYIDWYKIHHTSGGWYHESLVPEPVKIDSGYEFWKKQMAIKEPEKVT